MDKISKRNVRAWAEFRNLKVKIDQRLILSNINIKMNFGENILIIGPNGSGKSTFLKLLDRSIYPVVDKNSSLKLFNQENINIWDLRKEIGFLFKDMEERVNKGVKLKDIIVSGFTGTFNSRYTKLLSRTDLNKIERLIFELELNDIINQEFHTLSDGQKRRSMIARALVYEPKLLVLDEPFCNLDIKSNFILNKILQKLIDSSVNVIYSTHSLESILPNTNRVILIKDGQIINDGSPEEMINSRILSDLFNISIEVIKQGNYWRSMPSMS
tara:strand:+ start:715 stop:1527 length:813 start_codon:yes stop_codon:yes gene_type:complete